MSPLPESNSTAIRRSDTSTSTVAPIPHASLPKKLVPNHKVTKPTMAFSNRVPNVPKIFFTIKIIFMQKYDFISNFSTFSDNKKNLRKLGF